MCNRGKHAVTIVTTICLTQTQSFSLKLLSWLGIDIKKTKKKTEWVSDTGHVRSLLYYYCWTRSGSDRNVQPELDKQELGFEIRAIQLSCKVTYLGGFAENLVFRTFRCNRNSYGGFYGCFQVSLETQIRGVSWLLKHMSNTDVACRGNGRSSAFTTKPRVLFFNEAIWRTRNWQFKMRRRQPQWALCRPQQK